MTATMADCSVECIVLVLLGDAGEHMKRLHVGKRDEVKETWQLLAQKGVFGEIAGRKVAMSLLK